MQHGADILLYLGLGLISARLFGELFERLKLSSILGELIAGILIGGPFFTLIGIDTSQFMNVEELYQISQLGILFLLFIVGLDINLKEMQRIGKMSIGLSLTEVFFALIGGTVAGIFILQLVFNYALFFGLLFTATSIGITVRTLNDLGKINTKVGRTLLSVAVLDDFLALIFVLFVSETILSTDEGIWWKNILWHLLCLAIFVVVVIFVIPKLFNVLESRWNVFSDASTSHFSIGIVFSFLVLIAYVASFLDLSGAIMAFIFGLSIQQNKLLVKEFKETFIKIGEGALIPLFFFTVGAQFTLNTSTFSWLNLLLIVIGVLSKGLGSFLGASVFGFNKKSAGQIALGMTPRAEIVLVIAEIGLVNEIFTDDIFSMAILLVFITVLITPLLLRWIFKEPAKTGPTPEVSEPVEAIQEKSH